MLTHGPQALKTHSCNICDARYSHMDSLKRHIRDVHTGMNPASMYCCDICSKMFREYAKLSRHIHVHIGNKPYKCEICQKEFSRKYRLVSHTRIHTGD